MRLVTRSFALVALLLCGIPTSAFAQFCIVGWTSAVLPTAGVINMFPTEQGGANIVPPWGGEFEMTLRLQPYLSPTACDNFRPTTSVTDSAWMSSIAQFRDTTAAIWRWRVRVTGNMTGADRFGIFRIQTETNVQGRIDNIDFAVSQTFSRCSANDFDTNLFSFNPDGTPFHPPINIQVSNADGGPCSVSLYTTIRPPGFVGPRWENAFDVRLPTLSTDTTGGDLVLFPDGVGHVPSGQLRDLSILPVSSPFVGCKIRYTQLYLNLNGVRKRGLPVYMHLTPSQPPAGGWLACYRQEQEERRRQRKFLMRTPGMVGSVRG